MSGDPLTGGAVIFCARPLRLGAFYRDVAALRVTHEESGLVVLQSGSVHLVLHALRGEAPDDLDASVPAAPLVRRSETFIKPTFPVPDLGAARAAASAGGGTLEPAVAEWSARRFRACDGVDPEGNVFQLRMALPDEEAAERPDAVAAVQRIPVVPIDIARSLTELWSPRVIAELDDAYVKVAKVHGTLAWHRHAGEDELFFVLDGLLRLEFEDGAVDLGPGQMHVVPKGVLHNPVAESECLVMLVERKSTQHTGDVVTDRTRSITDQLRPA